MAPRLGRDSPSYHTITGDETKKLFKIAEREDVLLMMSSTSSSQLINRGNWEQERTLKDESLWLCTGNPTGYNGSKIGWYQTY